MFEGLGRVEFEGTVYLGYRTRFDRVVVAAVPPGASSETRQQVLSPQKGLWVDRESMLPAYDFVSDSERQSALDLSKQHQDRTTALMSGRPAVKEKRT